MSNVPSEPGEYILTWPGGTSRVALVDKAGYGMWIDSEDTVCARRLEDFDPESTWARLVPQAETQIVEAVKEPGIGVLELVDHDGEIVFSRVEDARAAQLVIDGLIAIRRLDNRLEALEDAELGDVIRWATGEDKLVVIRPVGSDITLHATKPIVEEPVAPEPEAVDRHRLYGKSGLPVLDAVHDLLYSGQVDGDSPEITIEITGQNANREPVTVGITCENTFQPPSGLHRARVKGETAVPEPVDPWTSERPSEPGCWAILWTDGSLGESIVSRRSSGERIINYVTESGTLCCVNAHSATFSGCRFRRIPLPVAPEPEFESCPWCRTGDRRKDLVGVTDKCYVVCECGARGPTSASRGEAIHAWNKRA